MNTMIDEASLSFATFIEESADLEGRITDPGKGVSMTVEEAVLNMPIEIDLHVEGGEVLALGAAAPLYYVETTVMPVYHQLKLTLKLEEPAIESTDVE